MIYIKSCTLISNIKTKELRYDYKLSNGEVVSSRCPLEFDVVDGKDVLRTYKNTGNERRKKE